MKLRKIPLEPLMQILQDLWEGGADFIDISGEQNGENESLKDVIQITVKPEYIIHLEEDEERSIQTIDMTFYNEDENKPLSDEDINELI
jgi:hypothetical protein